ncbi:hypothetical protein [Leifsonia sp. P73]|uniref:hypothetical protein n=1 Tax=Leifsonia sp. P73 TaxID=3423959 RepID=UPI003DA31E5D
MRRVRLARTTAIAALLVLSLTGCGLVQALTMTSTTPKCNTPTQRATTMNDPKNSQLDEAGKEEIYNTCQVTFDLTRNQLLKEDLGLPATARSVPNLSVDGLMTLTLHGSHGTLTAHTDRITFFTVADIAWVDEIAYFLTADTPEEFFTILRDGAEAYGFDKTSVERHIKSMKDHPDRGSKIALQPGYKLGFEVIYDYRYRGPGHVNTVIVSVHPTAREFQPLL